MYDNATISRVCGEPSAAYAANKQRGGRASQRGWRFEVLYAAYQIAQHAYSLLQAGGTGEGIWFQDQVGGFVDDLAVISDQDLTLSQAKSGQVSWTGGQHALGDDFRLQARLDEAMGHRALYKLVVATHEIRETMLAQRPPDLAHVDISVFHDLGRDVVALIARHPELAEALDRISLRESRNIVREQIFQAIVGAWVISGGNACLADLLLQLATRPDALVKLPGPDYLLPMHVVECLKAVSGFEWRVTGRHFEYRVGGGRGLLNGWAAYLCGTPEFDRFERYVVDRKPTRWTDVVRKLRREA